ncbi:MAG TPA: mandelate racemase/muconate lactonizing enzyme family protein [Geminicoccaceae bacterium]|nr:mandelate racemase/muconate lactonizing enzyme family protein [Geminicoccus sp.]HMU49928.1 mandelate racemase/muconate lactonizing enzyme family protein [Geminicoccaceae bacterium]
MTILNRITALRYAAPIEVPVVSSFARMTERPALLLRVEDRDGAFGWGEVWCNFPSCGAAHRQSLLADVIGPWAIGRDVAEPETFWERATAAFRVMAIQSGEYGPVAQVLAGLDCALWDMRARREGRSLAAIIGEAGPRPVPAYASGINPAGAEETVERARATGFRTFKLKTGFEGDMERIGRVRAGMLEGERLMIDYNQALDLETARSTLPRLGAFDLVWIEEPIAADHGAADFASLAGCAPAPLAGGENVVGESRFAALIEAGALGFVQPDIGKWGGISGCRRVAIRAMEQGACYCPHWLGGGVGLLASSHLLAGLGGDGLLEVDVNPNPLRDRMVPGLSPGEGGLVLLPQGDGLGREPEIEDCGAWLAARVEVA